MRTTLNVNDSLMRELKNLAKQEHRTIGSLIEAAISFYLGNINKKSKNYKLNWGTEKGKVLPGVNLENRDALFQIMED